MLLWPHTCFNVQIVEASLLNQHVGLLRVLFGCVVVQVGCPRPICENYVFHLFLVVD